MQQCPIIPIATEKDMSATASVASVRATFGDVLLPAEVRRASPSLARTAVYLDVIDEIGLCCHTMDLVRDFAELVHNGSDTQSDLFYRPRTYHVVQHVLPGEEIH